MTCERKVRADNHRMQDSNSRVKVSIITGKKIG